ncbi:DUF397 domain-containing protein [Streptomyces sp. NPDC057582]|uniref:DUF397 domain-containing protein n=1 Tax=unclassified Streptomyces TaxID=2593676 RepID=UPI0036A351A0
MPAGDHGGVRSGSEGGTGRVEPCPQSDVVHVRDSKRNSEGSPNLTLPLTAWTSFTQQVAEAPRFTRP